MYPRYITQRIQESLADTPAVFIMGPRQSGKTTLVKSLINETWTYISLDDQAQLEIARYDPVGFIRNLASKRIVLDEVQRLPELFVSIKQAIDENREPGRFLLTGSANAMLLPRLSDSLAGRMESIRLLPLSECEINYTTPQFLAQILAAQVPTTKIIRIRDYLLDRVTIGCFPEPLQRKTERRRFAWYQEYINALIQRDIQDLAKIDHLDAMAKLVKLCGYYSGKLINLTDFGNNLELDRNTIKKYLGLLTQLFLVDKLPAWHSNEYKKLIKAPKMHVTDTGLICAMRSLGREKLVQQGKDFGFLVETFVYNELRKQSVWIEEPLIFYHYRDNDKIEVDIIIENGAGHYFAIEVKATASLKATDFLGLQHFKKITGDRFKMGILLYDGDHTTAFGDNLFAVPIASLWSTSDISLPS